jgi:hypothetical protein
MLTTEVDFSYEVPPNQCTDDLCSHYAADVNFVYWRNQIAKQVRPSFPNVKIELLVYAMGGGGVWDRPSGIDWDPGLIIDQGDWHGYDNSQWRGQADGSGYIGTEYQANALDWGTTDLQVIHYDWYRGASGTLHVQPIADEFQPIYRSYVNHGAEQGLAAGMGPRMIWNNLTVWFTSARTLYDTSLSLADNLDRMLRIFGDGGSEIRAYVLYLEGLVAGQWRQADLRAAPWVAVADMGAIYRHFDNALNAESRPRLRDHIRLMRMALRYTDLSANGSGAAERYYMWQHFDSGTSGNIGYGIAMPNNGSAGSFAPDTWYRFEGPR